MCERDRQHGEALKKIEPEREGEKQTFDFTFLRKVSAKHFLGFILMKRGTNFSKIRCIVR